MWGLETTIFRKNIQPKKGFAKKFLPLFYVAPGLGSRDRNEPDRLAGGYRKHGERMTTCGPRGPETLNPAEAS